MGFQNHYWIDPLLGTSCFHSNRNDSSISLSQGARGPAGLSLTITLQSLGIQWIILWLVGVDTEDKDGRGTLDGE